MKKKSPKVKKKSPNIKKKVAQSEEKSYLSTLNVSWKWAVDEFTKRHQSTPLTIVASCRVLSFEDEAVLALGPLLLLLI